MLFPVFATPILDLEQPVPVPPRRWLPMLIGGAIGLCIAGIEIAADQGSMPRWNWPGFNGLMLIPTLYFGIAVHELGHLAAGKLVGLDAGGISVGPLSLTRSGGHWVIQFKWRQLFGGFFKPLITNQDFRVSRYVWMIAAGPIASLLFAVTCLVMFLHSGNNFSNITGTLFWSSLFLGLFSAVPFSAGLQKSDGARIWQLIRHPEQTLLFTALLAIQSEEARGVRPREWNSEQFQCMMAIRPSATEYLYCQLMAFYRRVDESEELEALGHLENVLGASNKACRSLRPLLFLEASSACARIKNDPRKALVWRGRALPLVGKRFEHLPPVDASIAMSQERFDDALQLWQRAREQVRKRNLNSGLARFALDKWAQLEEVCRVNLGSRPQ